MSSPDETYKVSPIKLNVPNQFQVDLNQFIKEVIFLNLTFKNFNKKYLFLSEIF